MPLPVVVPGTLAHINLALKTEALKTWQVRGSNKQLPDPRIPGTFPTVGPTGGPGRNTKGQV